MNKAFCILTLMLCFVLTLRAGQEPQTLVPGKPVEREIAGGQSHTYRITLQAGQFVRVLVAQKGIDVALELATPDGKQVVEVNITGPAMKSLSAEAEASGDYRLTVRALGPGALIGSYLLRLEVRAPTVEDKQRIAAERVLSEAARLSRQGAAAARQTVEKYEQALGLWRVMGDRYWQAHTLNLLGGASGLIRSYEKAIEHFEQALPIMREIKDRRGEGQTLHNLGLAYSLQGRQEKAIEYYEQALAVRRELKDGVAEGITLNSLGNIYFRSNSYDKAIECYEQSLKIRSELKDRPGEGQSVNNLGNVYSLLGRQEKAIEYYEQSLAIKRELKDRPGEGQAFNNLGNAYWFLSSYDKAVEYYHQALVVWREVKDLAGEGQALSNLGLAYDSLGRHQEAIKHHEQALPIIREVKDRVAEGLALDYMGNSYRGLGRYDKANECLEQALSIAREVKNRDNETSALYNFAKVELDRGDLTRARNFIEESLKVAESLRSDIYNQESRAAYFALMQKYSGFYIDLLMRLHRDNPAQGFDALAIEANERARARGLLELLTEAGANIRQGVEASLLERERALAKQLNAKAASRMQLLSRPHTPEQAAAVTKEISQLESSYEQAQADIRKASPHYAALTQPQPLKIREIQAQLDADTLLLEYALGEQRSYLWAISKDSLTSHELPKAEQINQSARQVYQLLTARSSSKRGESGLQRQQRISQAEANMPAAVHQLSKTLLSPVEAQLGGKRLVIVADGALQYIPFAMLPEPVVSDRRSEVRDQRSEVRGQRSETQSQIRNSQFAIRNSPVPLIVNHEVVSLPSASALAIQRSELAGRQLAPKMLAVIADPVFDRSDSRITTRATESSDKPLTRTFRGDDARSIEHLAENSADQSGATTLRFVIPRLPFTRQEATRLLALTPKDSSFGALDFEASRETVLKGDVSQYRYVHFATHGVLDSERPGLSALVFSMVDAQGKSQDGFLRAKDIYDLKLPAELVVLSACQTGLGKEIKGEGIVGLTRGFMYAGAARVVVSLWSVNDKATADLMTRFYEKMLKQGERPAAALRAAQVEMWKQKQWQSPYYWAAFTMQGEWR